MSGWSRLTRRSRFLPRLIEAIELQAIDSAAPVLHACHALGEWLAGKPRTTRRPAGEVPLGVVTPSWRPHVHDLQTGTVDRAAYSAAGNAATPSPGMSST